MRTPRLTEQQWKVLRIFTLFPDRARASWVDDEDHVIAPVRQPLACPQNAVAIKVHRCGDDGRDLLKGMAVDRTHLNAADALALAPFWEVPFQSVNTVGHGIGSLEWEPPERADIPVTGKVSWLEAKQLRARAEAEGRPVTVLLRQAAIEYLERCQ